jgi:uncharacterized repeat protein (TIGR01451 family)
MRPLVAFLMGMTSGATMKKLMSIHTLYAAALAFAALTGSIIASVQAAHAQTAQAKAGMTITSIAMVERIEKDKLGLEKKILKSPKDVIVVPGDHVVFTLSYANKGAEAAEGFRATNPMPGAVQFISATEDWAEMSVDGGQNWGKLADLVVKVTTQNGAPETTRPAHPEDVTHVRWVFSDLIAPGVKGAVSYRGIIK